ncbi:MAG: 50S ribosomal protein L6, partial [Actinobacteria bacterium]|nr:50S ribosomal protein L6 [Actinomycetota bacterium]
MSRIGRLPIPVPTGVQTTIAGQDVVVTGPKGSLSLTVAAPIEVRAEEGNLIVVRPNDERQSRALH